jgi:sugar lactone lactonase YvrE
MALSPARIGAIVLILVAVSAATALGLWGTRWSVPQAPAAGAGYTLRDAWDGSTIPHGGLQRPIGIAVAPAGDVYVTDARLRVVRFTAAGEFVGEWGREGDGRGEFRNPVGVAVDRDGAVYVSDYEQDRIQKFTADGEFLLDFGRAGSGLGQLSAPAGLAVDEADAVYVADFYNHRVQKFRPDGSFDAVIGDSGRLGAGALHYPTGVHVTAQSEILVADAYNYQLQWFDTSGQPLRRAGYHLFWLWPRPTASTTGFYVPTDAAADPRGIIHVADSGNHRIVMVSPAGEYVAHWQIPNASLDVFSPEHIAVSPDGSTLYATDLAGGRVLVLTVKPPA